MSKEKVISPCISICKTDPVTGYCYGCARTNAEKRLWKDEKATFEWKIKNGRKFSHGVITMLSERVAMVLDGHLVATSN